MSTDATAPELIPDGPAEHLAEAWASARAVWEDIVLMFDTPRGLAEHGWMIRRDHARLQGYLRALTALVQRLVLILALSLDVPTPKPQRPRPRVRHYRVCVRSHFHKWPETWPAGLAMPLSPRAPRRRVRPPSDTLRKTVAPLWGPAQRLEALRRLIEDPMPRARRLALLMARRRARMANRCDRPAVLDTGHPPRTEETTPYLVTRIFPWIHAAAEAAVARRKLEPG
jgi:hypothetical protein